MRQVMLEQRSRSQARSPVHCCCSLRISACSPFSVLAWSCCRNSRFFWALCSWFSSAAFAVAMSEPETQRVTLNKTVKLPQSLRFNVNLQEEPS